MVFHVIRAQLSFVLSQIMRLALDRRTDGRTEISSLDRVCILHSMQRGKSDMGVQE